MDVALVSCADLPEPDPDAAPLSDALSRAGIRSTILAWDDPDVDWSWSRLTVLRSCWNYPHHHDRFLRWAEGAALRSELWNPLPTVRWNSHKGYLLELARRGIPIVPTVLLPRGSREVLVAIRDRQGWDAMVVKPAVSAGSFRTMLVAPDDLEAGEAHLRALAAERDVLVQQYLPSVEGHGERAVMWIDGELTHAVRKGVRFADQEEHVSAVPVAIEPAEAALTRRVLEAVEGSLLYARVDLAPGPDGEPVVMELELIEPSMYFGQCPGALDRFVAALKRLLGDTPAGR
jgi:hypothetical protein